MGIKAAVDAISAWSVTGVTNLGMQMVDTVPPSASLPGLVLRLGGGGGEMARPLYVDDAVGHVVVYAEHRLLVAGAGVGEPGEVRYATLTHLDNYLAKLVTDWMLGGALYEPLRVLDVYVGRQTVWDAIYYGALLRMRWVLKVG